MVIACHVVGTGDERGDVGAHPRRRGERMPSRTVFQRGGVHRSAVRHDLPDVGRRHPEGECRLEIRLVEAGIHPLRVRRLELRVQIHRAVDRIHETVQALAGVHVCAHGLDHENVLGRQIGEHQPALAGPAGHVQRSPVEGGRRDGVADEVDPRRASGLDSREGDLRSRPERRDAGAACAVGQIQVDGVAADRQQRGALRGLDTGQVGGRWHGVVLPG